MKVDPARMYWLRAGSAEPGEIILVSRVQPESEAPAPWVRTIELVSCGQFSVKDLRSFNRAVRDGELELVQDVIQVGIMEGRGEHDG